MSKYSAISFDRKPWNEGSSAFVAVAEPEAKLVVPPAESEAAPPLKTFYLEDGDDDPFGRSIAEKLTAASLEDGLSGIRPRR